MTAICIPITSILGKKNANDLDELLSDIEKDKDKYSAVVGCFDACQRRFVHYFKDKYPWLHILANEGNALKFTRNSNVGLRYVMKHLKDDAFLVNQDCRLPRYHYMKLIAGEGLSTPQSIENMNYVFSQPFVADEFDPYENKWYYRRLKRERLYNNFAFYCPHFSKNLLENVGILDGALRVVMSDDDFCIRTLLAGFPVETVNVKIFHKGSHIDTSSPDWVSSSGSYGASDLGKGLRQYLTKYQLRCPHEEIIPTVLKTHKWKEEMRIL